MIEAVQAVLVFFLILAILNLILGLIKPVWVLWFLDSFHRLKVIQVYGSLSILITIILFFIRLIF